MAIYCQPAAWPGDVTAAIGANVELVDSTDAAGRLLAERPQEELVVVGPGVELEDALTFAVALRVHRPSAGVVLLRDAVDVPLMTRALHAGVRDVVQAGQLVELRQACERSRQLSRSVVGEAPEPRVQGQVVTVFSAKGGCGKTTMAVNLAVALSEGGTRKVCLVDLDLAFGDVAITLQLDPARTITDAVSMAGRVDDTGAASLLTPYRGGLAALLAPVAPGDAEKVPAALVGELLGVLRTMADFVVVDTPSQFSEHVLNAMDASQHLVLLTTPEVPALKNMRLTLDMLDLLSYPADVRTVVLNRADDKVGLTADDVQRVVRTPIAAQVPASRDVPVSINKGIPLTVSSPAHPFSQAIGQLARERFAAPLATAPAGPSAPAKKPSGLARLRKGRG